QTLWASRSANAQREIAAGNAYPALANAAANLREMEARGDRDDAALERLRIGTVLASAPQLIDVIPVAGAKANDIDALAFSPDAKLLAFRTGEGRTIRLVDVASGRELWKVDITDKSFGMYDMRNWPIGLLRFSGDGQRLVAYTLDYNPGGALSTMRPHYLDSVMIDVATGKVVEPPKAFTDFLATDYADDARFALLFDKHGGVQRWRTQPWRPAGDKVQFKDNLTVRTDYGLGPLLGEALLPASGNPMVLVSNANLKFRTYDARHMRPLRSLSLDSAQGRGTAWAFSADEKQLAIGTVTGQIALWNLATGATRWLQPQLSGTITTLRFSADDSRLLAMSNEPSELRVFDPRSGAMVAEPVKLSDDLSPNVVSGIGAEFGSNASTLLTHHWAGNATLWQLPAPGFPLRPPVAIAPTMTALGARFALATDPRSRLMATAENGSIKLWRLRSSPLTDRVAPPMVTDVLHFDGHHLVSVAGNRVSVFDAATDRTVGTTIVLPQAPTFAVLVGGTRLIAIAGRELGCWNWRNGKACWPVLTLPDSLLRLGFAAQAPVLALSTGSNVNGVFFEHVRLVDLASGRQRGGTIDLRGPLGTLRLSDDGRLLMAWEDAQSRDALRDVLYVIDADNGAIVRRLVHRHGAKGVQSIYDARLMTDGSIFSITNCSWDRPNCDDTGGYLWHWSADGHVIAKTRDDGLTGDLLPMPASRGIIELVYERWLRRQGKPIELAAPDSNSLDDAAAVSPDGRLLALAAINGVALTDIPHNESLLPELKLPLPNDEMVQQLAFSPDDSRLIGRTTSGRWFQWPIVSDQRPVPEIERDVGFRDLSQLGSPHPPLPDAQRRQLRAADPGPLPVAAESDIRAVDADVPAPVPDARYQPLDIDPIANVDPRHAMTHATRNPPQPQSLPSLPRGLQRYDGVDFLLSRAVQLSGQPQNLLDAEFPSASRSLVIGRRRIEAVDAMVMQYISLQGVIGSMQLHYADGSDRTLDIMSPRDTVQHWIDAQHVEPSLRMGWLGSYAQQLMIPIGANGESTFSRSYIVRLVNPEPNKAVVSISLGAPPRASPGLLFLALTLEPVQRVPNQRKVALARPR
ncbi:MAG TPA: WD40 repeat domain-containing protein, partial [Rhodanobacteraceae bacterium]|nr:WD40 repeat domain-containing protein [Rhodanobacteraceae bacterium]